MANNTHFAVFKRSGFWLIPAEILIYACLKLFGNKSAIFPAALWVWKALPFAIIIRIASSWLLIGMSCEINQIYFTLNFIQGIILGKNYTSKNKPSGLHYYYYKSKILYLMCRQNFKFSDDFKCGKIKCLIRIIYY